MLNPDKIVIGTGDARQMNPIVDVTITQNHEKYARRCLNITSKYRLNFKQIQSDWILNMVSRK